MSFNDRRPSGRGELANKNETEIPIGEPRDLGSYESGLWRCRECGELGRLSGALPEECPGCASPKEEFHYWPED